MATATATTPPTRPLTSTTPTPIPTPTQTPTTPADPLCICILYLVSVLLDLTTHARNLAKTCCGRSAQKPVFSRSVMLTASFLLPALGLAGLLLHRSPGVQDGVRVKVEIGGQIELSAQLEAYGERH